MADMRWIDAAILWPNGRIYFFQGDQYFSYDIGSERHDPGYPRSIQSGWPGLSRPFLGAVAWPDDKAYFFDSVNFQVYDIGQNRVTNLLPTHLTWQGVLAGTDRYHQVDAAVMWPARPEDGVGVKAYFFQEDRYYRVDPGTKKVDPNYPLSTTQYWPGLYVTGQRFVGGFVWPKPIDGRLKAYFFHTAQYLRFDIDLNRTDSGYPLPIAEGWS